MGWCLQLHALSTSIQGQPGKCCLTREGAGATSVHKWAAVRATLSVKGQQKSDNTWICGVTTAQGWAALPGLPGLH